MLLEMRVHFFEPSKVDQNLDALSPVIILAFGEAHLLTKVHGNAESPWSRFGVLTYHPRTEVPPNLLLIHFYR